MLFSAHLPVLSYLPSNGRIPTFILVTSVLNLRDCGRIEAASGDRTRSDDFPLVYDDYRRWVGRWDEANMGDTASVCVIIVVELHSRDSISMVTRCA